MTERPEPGAPDPGASDTVAALPVGSPATPDGPPYGVLVRARSGAELVVDVPLAHGQDPLQLLARAGWRVERPVAATREAEAIVLEFAVRAAAPCARPMRLSGPIAAHPAPRPAGGAAAPVGQETPVRRQRVSAAVLVVADVPPGCTDSDDRPGPGGRCVLATRYSGKALRWDGTWGLPGGGVDPGEEPAEAARREAAEETGQDVLVAELAFVQSSHWVGRAPDGVLEDFQAVRLVFRGECDRPGDVVVHDVGGTTSAAAWVPLADAGALAWAPGPREQLAALGVLPRP